MESPAAILVLIASTGAALIGSAAVLRADDPGRGERPNFAVVGASADRGRMIRDAATRIRRDAFSELLGSAAPEPWIVPCEIHVHATPEDFAAALGGPPALARGATSLEFGGDQVTMRRIDVMGDGADIVPDALAHEIVHVVLADRFTAAPPPRWADEGLALLFDPARKQQDHDMDFREALRHGLAWRLDDLLTLEDYPHDSRRQRVFYGQSAALARWLVARRDAATFVRFIDDCGTIGTAAALQRHYEIGSIDSLELAWKEVAPINSFGMTARPTSVAAD